MRIPHLARLAAFALPFLAGVAPAAAATYIYSAILNPRQQVPPVSSTAMGGGQFIINTDDNEVAYWISFGGLSSAETEAHVHSGAAGTNGSPSVTLVPENPKIGVWYFDEAQEAALLAGQTYVDIHSDNFPDGELRGQIVPFNALLGANQESPVNPSPGSGWAIATVDTALNQISYRIFYEGLTGAVTQSHFHGNANYGTNAGVKVGITAAASPMIGTVSYAAADEAAMLTGRWYINLHTAANPGGEIRGQFVPRVMPLDGLQESIILESRSPSTYDRIGRSGRQGPAFPPITSAGFALVTLDTVANVMGFDVRVVSLSATETASHIHGFAEMGSIAPPLHTLPLGTQKLGTWSYGAANEIHVFAGRTYFNVHTSAFPDGEIRGQIQFPPGFENAAGVDDQGPLALPGLLAAPNPSGGRTSLTFHLSRTGQASLEIVGVDGRRVRELARGRFAPGPHAFEWDGRDADGRAVAPGVYFAVARTPDGAKSTRLARLR
jgi:hypothetical protein